MLKDAALLQLDLLLAALEHDLILKDSSLYNVQFTGARALFIDVGSFERLREDELWVGYRPSSRQRRAPASSPGCEHTVSAEVPARYRTTR